MYKVDDALVIVVIFNNNKSNKTKNEKKTNNQGSGSLPASCLVKRFAAKCLQSTVGIEGPDSPVGRSVLYLKAEQPTRVGG